MVETVLKEIMYKYEGNARPDSEIDTSDIPALTDEQLALFRPVKKLTSIRIDADSLAYLQKKKGWQTRVNDYIRHGIASGQL